MSHKINNINLGAPEPVLSEVEVSGFSDLGYLEPHGA